MFVGFHTGDLQIIYDSFTSHQKRIFVFDYRDKYLFDSFDYRFFEEKSRGNAK